MLGLGVVAGAPAGGAGTIDDHIKVEMERRQSPGLALVQAAERARRLPRPRALT
jgi:hypothetical protein